MTTMSVCPPDFLATGISRPVSFSESGIVLFVEDQEMIARMLLKAFARAGLVVSWAKNGAEAMDVFVESREKISLAFVDCQLPDFSGGELCLRLREETPGLPVLLTSGRDQQMMRGWLEGGGPTDFVAKPYQPSEIVMRMRALLATAA